jgi:GDP/UDP-N,N'-diacetylbacillosamine 2-epimerase (hydrolysing)
VPDQSSDRKIAILSVARSDFGRYRPVLRSLSGIASVHFNVLASGNHFDPRYGETITEIKDSGYSWVDGLGLSPSANLPGDIGRAIAEGTNKLTGYFDDHPPDLIVLLGDRYEMLAGAMAALGFNIPIVHIHGGAVTEGAIDDLVRHALTKLSHFHMVSCNEYAQRLRNMGEENWRIHVTGAPGLDELPAFADMSRAELFDEIGLDPEKTTLLVCCHPVTLKVGETDAQVKALRAALDATRHQLVLTYPNNDLGSEIIIEGIEAVVRSYDHGVRLIKNAGTKLFTNLLANVDALVGNSSAGIVEAPSFKLPVVNIGTRQTGKVKSSNIIDVDYDTPEIVRAIELAMSEKFRRGLAGLVNPYGDGSAGPRIAKLLATLPIDQKLLVKKFTDT